MLLAFLNVQVSDTTGDAMKKLSWFNNNFLAASDLKILCGKQRLDTKNCS